MTTRRSRTIRGIEVTAVLAATLMAACGGPDSLVPPPPAQTVNAYWVGVEQKGDIHLHITFAQSGTSISLIPDCFVDRCSLYPFSNAGVVVVGSDFPVPLKSASGTFTNPSITFTFTLANDRTFSFTGRVAEDKLMQGKISGTTLTETNITLEKRQ